MSPSTMSSEPPAQIGSPGSRGEQAPPWSPFQRLIFRFSCLYFVLYSLSYPADFIPFGVQLTAWPIPLWNAVVGFFGSRVFDLAPDLLVRRFGGSGDTTFDFVQLFSMLVMATVGAVVWSLVDRRRGSYRRAAQWLVIAVSFFVGAVSLFYGFGKVFHVQFGAPSLTRLLTPYGDSSPMGLAWTFMGASAGYSMFTGLGEVVGGLLLLFRRTRTLGALLMVVVMGHVVVLNLCYDIPVKLFSSHLLVFSIALLFPDRHRLVAFCLNRATPEVKLEPLFAKPKWNAAATGAAFVVAAGLLVFNLHMGSTFRQEMLEQPPFHGIHDVETFVWNDEERPPLLTDETRWRAVVMAHPGRLTIQKMDGELVHYGLEHRLDDQVMVVSGFQDPYQDDEVEWTLGQPAPGILQIDGEFEGGRFSVRTQERSLDDFLLTNRGFRWISERPFNR